jgi:hypothetical protein
MKHLLKLLIIASAAGFAFLGSSTVPDAQEMPSPAKLAAKINEIKANYQPRISTP